MLKQNYHPIVSYYSKTPHRIFAGPNALKAACFYIDNGFEGQPKDVYGYVPRFKKIMHYTSNTFNSGFSQQQINGHGNHAKIYWFRDTVILSSQNNVTSGLFEFAIIYEGISDRPKLLSFLNGVFRSALQYVSTRKEKRGDI